MTIGERIKARRVELEMSQEELAQKLGYKSRSSINKIELGQQCLTQSKIKAIADALNTSPSYIMGWLDEQSIPNGRYPITPVAIPPGFEPLPEMVEVPLIGRIACGEPITAEENIEAQVSVPVEWGAAFSLRCCGESMLPRIQDGDIVGIRPQPMVENGEIAAVRIGTEATLKHVYLYPNYIELRPENPEYESIIKIGEDMNEVKIEGKAVGLCRKL